MGFTELGEKDDFSTSKLEHMLLDGGIIETPVKVGWCKLNPLLKANGFMAFLYNVRRAPRHSHGER